MREWIVALALVVVILREAQAHDGYSNWINKADRGCCNDHDCAPISDTNVRYLSDHVEVKVRDEWCEVLPHQYLKRGNAPDWSTAHVCIQKLYVNGVEVQPKQGKGGSRCHTLLCFQPKPMF